MKAIRIILFILILVGIAALATQRIWVPKLVDKIIKYEDRNKPILATDPIESAVKLVDGRQCYSYNHEATKDAPYTVNEFIDVTIKGEVVTGTKTGNQKGPDMTNGYTGTITGKLNQNTIYDVYSYIVEGSKNKEGEIYRANKTGIEKLRYPLVEKGGVLVPDMTKEFQLMSYARVPCTASN